MLNTVSLHGRLTRDVELRHTNSGKAVATLTIANDTGYGDRKQTNFFNCVVWDKSAEIISQYFNKGSEIVINGELSQRNYEDRNGNKRETVEVIVRSFDFCGSKNSNSNNDYGTAEFTEVDNEDNLPF